MNIIGILFLSTLIEGTLTYLFGKNQEESRPWLRYASLFLGVVLAVVYQVDVPAMAGLTSSVSFAGYIVSGLIIGRGANYINDIFALIQTPKPVQPLT